MNQSTQRINNGNQGFPGNYPDNQRYTIQPQVSTSSQANANLEFPTDVTISIFGREVELTKAILECNQFQIEDKVAAGRVAKALDRYIFLATNFDGIAEAIYSRSGPTIFVDKLSVFSNYSGLSALLPALQVVGQPISDTEKVKMLLKLQASTLLSITNLSITEQIELSKIQELISYSNPISDRSKLRAFICILLVVLAAIFIGTRL